MIVPRGFVDLIFTVSLFIQSTSSTHSHRTTFLLRDNLRFAILYVVVESPGRGILTQTIVHATELVVPPQAIPITVLVSSLFSRLGGGEGEPFPVTATYQYILWALAVVVVVDGGLKCAVGWKRKSLLLPLTGLFFFFWGGGVGGNFF